MLRAPNLPWGPMHHIKQEPMEPPMANGFMSSHSEGFHSASPSSSSRGSPPAPRSPPFNPLTPPSYEPSPENQPRASSHAQGTTAVTPPKSPSPSPPWVSNSDGVPSPGEDSAPEEDDEEPGFRVPAVNSHGKVKTFKCKQCEFVAVTKVTFWAHNKTHMKPERTLNCPTCPFVTEYKHHLEYHMRNHFGSKPFQCPQCSYSCVNKSMLNSHLKSHSNIYQYRCADCNYATKYCHSLKLHLRKYQHQPAMVLNQDGTPNPLPIIDVYGTRRGPKQRPLNKEEQLNNNNTIQQSPSLYQNPFGINFPYSSLLPHPMLFPNNNNIPEPPIQTKNQEVCKSPQKDDNISMRPVKNLSPHLNAMQQRFFSEFHQQSPNFNLPTTLPQGSPVSHKSPRTSPYPILYPSPRISPREDNPDALDLTQATKQEAPTTTPLTPTTNLKNRRKGRAFKLDRSVPRVEQADDNSNHSKEGQRIHSLYDNQSVDMQEVSKTFNEPPKDIHEDTKPVRETPKEAKPPAKESYDCQFCDIVFKDIIMYTMHMGYHGFQDPFTCNMCGHKSTDKISFFVHIARSQHS